MTFSLTRPSSPSREEPISVQGHDDDHLSIALHAALSSLVPGSSPYSDHLDMIKEKEKAGIDIVVDSDCLSLKGTGVDVEPALLKGDIVLHLREPTSIKEVTLQFRGKAKLPLAPTESLPLSASPQWYTICNHEWSFLEGEKSHSHTLKAGFHRFPFQLQLGGSLPSSMASGVFGGAHVGYKLRAVAIRPGLAHNLQAVMPISVVRTFAPQALEYQQSLEIENTWPNKLMYSIMIPHKAWAAGDQLTAIVKFSPLSKGVRVLTVTTTIHEIIKLHCRGGVQEHTQSVVTTNHEVPNGNAERHGVQGPPMSTSFPVTPGLSSETRLQSFGSLAAVANQLGQVPSTASTSAISSDPSSSSAEPSMSTAEVPMGQDDVVAHLVLFIPKSVTPSHALEPITVSHRIRWSILMSNLDGHTSELRCSLPLHILDGRLLDEATANSAATRRLLLGSREAPIDEDQDAELPSYSAHVRDRVANMYLLDSANTRVLNPRVHSSVSPIFMSDQQSLPGARSPSGAASPLMSHPVSSHVPHEHRSETSAPLDWVNSGLPFSLSDTVPPRSRANTGPHPHTPDPANRPGSGPLSRRGSRAPSPERHLTMTSLPASHETFVHDSLASRMLPGVFSIQMKPHTSLTSTGWLSSRANSHSNLASLVDVGHVHRGPLPRLSGTATTTMPVSGLLAPTPVTSEGAPENALWHRAFTEVPDYDVASRGFIGGVTPLTSMHGLPSYEEAERNANRGTDIGGDDGQLTIRRTASGHEQGA